MSCLGVHMALSDDHVAALLAKAHDAERLAFLQQVLEPAYFAEPQTHLAESDKAWDAMHRALTDGGLRDDGGEYPLGYVVLGGRSLYDGDDYIIRLKSPAEAKDVAAAIAGIDEAAFRARYDAIDADDYGMDLDDEDFGYTWEWFQRVRELFATAAAEGRHVLFSADQ